MQGKGVAEKGEPAADEGEQSREAGGARGEHTRNRRRRLAVKTGDGDGGDQIHDGEGKSSGGEVDSASTEADSVPVSWNQRWRQHRCIGAWPKKP